MNKILSLKKLGIKEKIENAYEESFSNYYLGRVSLEHKHTYRVLTEYGEVLARVSGKFSFTAEDSTSYPSVGDWVAVDRFSNDSGEAIIHHLFPRFTKLSRKAAGSTLEEQIIASNIDIVFICMSLNNDFNLRKLERYLSVVWDSGALPKIILTKSDLCDDAETKKEVVESLANGVDIFVISAYENEGIENVMKVIESNLTVALIGSSGVGKSTLTNALLGEEKMFTNSIRESDDRGKHTTTHREMQLIPNGGILIDTPGMRELQLFSVDTDSSFSDVERLSNECRFSNCTHSNEPGCAVKSAISDGVLSMERYNSYLKLEREIAIFEKKKSIARKKATKKTNKKNRTKRVSKSILSSYMDY